MPMQLKKCTVLAIQIKHNDQLFLLLYLLLLLYCWYIRTENINCSFACLISILANKLSHVKIQVCYQPGFQKKIFDTISFGKEKFKIVTSKKNFFLNF